MNVTPGIVFSDTTPITATNLNLLGQPSITIGAGEVVTANIASNITISGLTISPNTPLVGSASTDAFSATISLTISSAKGNTRLIACTGSTGSAITPSSAGTAGQELTLIFTTDGTGGNVITYASPFATTGTHTLTGANKRFTSNWKSDGTKWCELSRTSALT